MGPKFSAQDGDVVPEDSLLLNAVVGKVKDIRDFQENTIREWVQFKWTTHDEISVKKVGKLFFFFCLDVRDKENLTALGSACFDGALVVFTNCVASASFEHYKFLHAPIWVKVEGLPLMYNKTHVARRVLQKIGRVLYFDNKSTSPGFKDYLRAKVVIPVNNPLIPGFFFDNQNGEPDWVHFRYEGVFVFYTKCGRIGHRQTRCRMPMNIAKDHIDIVMHNISQGGVQTHVSPTFFPLYFNKIIGLKRVERNRTTEVNLVQYSWDRDEEGDSPSEMTIDEDEEDPHDHSSSSDSGDSGDQDDRDYNTHNNTHRGYQPPDPNTSSKRTSEYSRISPRKAKSQGIRSTIRVLVQ